MSKTSHKCTCEHENVSYCKTCKVCHCADCNQEWRAGVASYYPQWSYTLGGQQGLVSGQGNLYNGQYKTTPTTIAEPTYPTTTTCGHKS